VVKIIVSLTNIPSDICAFACVW